MNSKQIRTICIVTAILICAGSLSAEILYVGSHKEFTSIQQAIDASVNSDVVIVDPGIYYENVDFLGKNITLTSTDPDTPSIVENTVIDAGGSGSVVTFANGESNDAILAGFTITGGYGTVNPLIGEGIYWGAGIYCDTASPTIIQNIIKNNIAPSSVPGGGYGGGTEPTDDEDPAIGYGGGIGCFQSDAVITRNIIRQNDAFAGAGVIIYFGKAVLANNVIVDNTAIIGGGAVLLAGGELIHNTLNNNAAETAGNLYAVSDDLGGVKIINNIVVNAAGGGGIFSDGATSIRHNDVWNNTGGNYVEITDLTGSHGNISLNPGFIDGYHISDASACYEAGDPDFVPYSWQRDIDGEAAVMNVQPDIGADEVTGNARPVADAGPDQFFDTIPADVVLDGNGSYDLNPDDMLTYSWTQTGGTPVVLSNEAIAAPRFTPSVEDVYYFELTVSDGVLTSSSDEVMIVVGNRAPRADAGQDAAGEPGETIVLDGRNSSDPDDDDQLYYTWTQVSGPSVELVGQNTPQPSFVAGGEGDYVFELIVDDGTDQSLPDTVTVTIRVGSEYDAYGYQWIDSDSAWGPRYYWIDIQNTGKEITGLAYTFEDFVGPFPIGFNFNFYGNNYQQFYVQSNGVINFDPVVIPYENQPVPAADGYNGLIAWMWTYMYPDSNSKVYYQQFDGFTVIQFVDYVIGWDGAVNAEVILYDSGKIIVQYKDFTEDAYTYIHTIGIENENGTIGTQVAYNQYEYLHDKLAIEFSFGPPHQPVAMAGPDQQVHEIQEITLNGTASYDRDFSDVLTYTWTQVSGPTVELSDWTAAQPVFLPEIEAEYTFQLIVSDGILTSYPDEVVIVVGNRAPVADAGTNRTVHIGNPVWLDGSDSYDPDPGATLRYTWSQVQGPAVDLEDSDTAMPHFDCIEDGLYAFQLVVDDGHKQSAPDTVEFITVDVSVHSAELNLQNIGTYAHYGDVSGNTVMYGVGSACDYTWNPKYKDLTTGAVSTFNTKLMQPKIDGDLVVWMKYGNGFGNPWYHEPCNSSVFVRNIATGQQKTLRNWTWSDSYGHPVVSGTKVVWMEHHDLDPKPSGSSEANRWWNTPFSICGADVSDWDNPVYFTVDENVGHHDPYPCHSYGEDFDDVIDICGDIVVWEADGNIYGANISNIKDIQVFPICLDPGRQYDPAVSGNTVVWTDERNDGGDIYGADISNIYNINVFEIVTSSGTQQQPAIDGALMAYVDGGLYDGQIKFSCLTKNHGGIAIPLDRYYGIGPAIDNGIVVWQSAPYGDALGISLKASYSIADGAITNITKAKRYDYIQHAIDDAQPADQIVVAPGCYDENIFFKGKDIVLRSLDPSNAAIAAKTIIRGRGNGATVTFDGSENETCVLQGFTITGGYSTTHGGGIRGNDSNAAIRNCVFLDNTVNGAPGGGIWGIAGTISHCIFENNRATAGGALAKCSGLISNCLMINNIGELYGSALHNCDGIIVNCTMVNDAQPAESMINMSDGILENCIIQSPSGPIFTDSTAVTRYCCYPGAAGEGDIDTEPLFVNPSEGDYYLSPDSPCINAGNPDYVLQEDETDLNGWTRIVDFAVDMGSYEFDGQSPRLLLPVKRIQFYVSQDISLTDSKTLLITNGGGAPLNWQISEDCPWLSMSPSSGENIHETDQTLVSVDANELPEGVYRYSADVSSDNAVNRHQPLDIILHVNRTIFNIPSDYKTIQHAIDLSQDNETIIVSPGSYNENINLKGKNITLTSIDPTHPDAAGQTIIRGRGNGATVTFDGSENETCVLQGFTITGGYSKTHGGGIRGNDSNAAIRNCVFLDNTVNGAPGGGIWGIAGTISHCIFENNRATAGGALAKCSGLISNCLMINNIGELYGSALHNCDGIIVNCTMVNDAQPAESMINISDGVLENCIIQSPSGPIFTDSTAVTRYCCYPGAAGEGDIDTDPQFVNPAHHDYRLLPGSPCIDAGTDTGIYDDLEGNLRPFNVLGVDNNGDLGEFDMGAYETTFPIVEVPTKITPQILHCGSKGRWVIAHVVLPAEIDLQAVNTETPALLEPMGIESEYINCEVNEDGRVAVDIAFDRATVCSQAIHSGPTEISVLAALTTSQYFFGADTINMNISITRQIGVFASQWLQTGNGLEADLDGNGYVNLIDLSILARQINEP